MLDLYRYLEAAYLYYLHPEHGIIMSDYDWDVLGRKLEQQGVIAESGSLFQMREEDYPEHIRKKYAD
jgi:hypothetical protein